MKTSLFVGVFLLCFCLANCLEDLRTNEKDVWLTPKKEYDVVNRRFKYGTSSVNEDKLLKKDCEDAYGLRSFMQPVKTDLKVIFPSGIDHNEDLKGKAPILVISGGKPEILIQTLVENKVVDSTEDNKWVLWYSPFRPERAERKAYVIVHHLEAENYKAQFEKHTKDKIKAKEILESIRLVSCQINPASEKPANTYYGFGLNRYCGMAFMAKKGVKKFWMADDTTIVLSKIPDKLSEVEALSSDVGVIGFKSAGEEGIVNSRTTSVTTMKKVMTTEGTMPGSTTVELEGRGKDDFLEQLYFFNTDVLDKDLGGKFRSFSPMFLSSKEDMTLSYDLFLNKVPVKFVKEALIYKVNLVYTDFDNTHQFSPDKQQLLDATLASKMTVQFSKEGTWGFFAKNIKSIGKVEITDPKNALAEVEPVVSQKEEWINTVSKTLEVVLYKCAVAAFAGKEGVKEFNPDATYFQFEKSKVEFK